MLIENADLKVRSMRFRHSEYVFAQPLSVVCREPEN